MIWPAPSSTLSKPPSREAAEDEDEPDPAAVGAEDVAVLADAEAEEAVAALAEDEEATGTTPTTKDTTINIINLPAARSISQSIQIK